jgi:hypothetical protein
MNDLFANSAPQRLVVVQQPNNAGEFSDRHRPTGFHTGAPGDR